MKNTHPLLPFLPLAFLLLLLPNECSPLASIPELRTEEAQPEPGYTRAVKVTCLGACLGKKHVAGEVLTTRSHWMCRYSLLFSCPYPCCQSLQPSSNTKWRPRAG